MINAIPTSSRRVVAWAMKRCADELRHHDFDQRERAHVRGRGQGESDEPELRRQRPEKPCPQGWSPGGKASHERISIEQPKPGDKDGGLQSQAPMPASWSPASRTSPVKRQDRAPKPDRRKGEKSS